MDKTGNSCPQKASILATSWLLCGQAVEVKKTKRLVRETLQTAMR